MSEIEDVKNYLSTDVTPARPYRNEKGGNILFRPVVLTEYVKASIRIANKYEGNYKTAFSTLGKIRMELSDNPWIGVLWDGKKMIPKADKKLIMLLILKMCGNDFLEPKECSILVDKFRSALNFKGDISEIERTLDSLVQ